MTSILDVAREANVAVSTVSLVLNHRDRVSPETLQRVDHAISQLGYRPRPRHRATDKPARKSRVALKVGFIYTLESMHDASVSLYCREVVAGIQDALNETGSTLSIIRGADHVDHDIMLHQQLQSQEFDGIILFGPEPSNGYLEFLSETGVPLVVFNRFNPNGKFSCITLNYYAGARLAINHLATLGHTKIGVIYATQNTNAFYYKLAAEGVADEFKKLGFPPVFEGTYEGISHPDDVGPLLTRALNAGVTALYSGDRVIRHSSTFLEKAGIRAPEDISLIGMDNLNITYRGKRLTSVGYDRVRMGRKAVKMLQRLLQHPEEVSWMASAVPCSLFPGQTTGAPGKHA